MPFFPPMTFFAVLDTSDAVELVDLTVDADFEWDAGAGTGENPRQ